MRGALKYAMILTSAALCDCSSTKMSQEIKPEAPSYFIADPATSATIAGKLVFKGREPARKRVNMDEERMCVKINTAPVYEQSVVTNKDHALANAFVYIKHGLEGKQFEPPSKPVTIDQHGCWITPRVVGVQTKQQFQVTNSDPVTHNIHPMSVENRQWNQSQEPGAPAIERTFVRPEILIPLKCNVHSWMRAWVAVVDHPYFAVTGADGTFQIDNIPPGEYDIEVWHEALGKQERHITLAASARQALAFEFKGE